MSLLHFYDRKQYRYRESWPGKRLMRCYECRNNDPEAGCFAIRPKLEYNPEGENWCSHFQKVLNQCWCGRFLAVVSKRNQTDER